jgi:hypothetical protein
MSRRFSWPFFRSSGHLSRALDQHRAWAAAVVYLTVAQAGVAIESQAPVPLRQQAQAPTAKPDKAETKAVVPFEMSVTNHMLVEARINDKGPYHLIFDLGAPITLLSNRVSEATEVVKVNAPRSFMFGMRGEAEVTKLEVGKLTVNKLPVIVLDHPILKALEEITSRRIDGIMGFTFFAQYRTTIDYRAHQMTFEPINYVVRDLLRELPDRLLGPKVSRHHVLAPRGIWGFRLGEPTGGLDSLGVPVVEVYGGSAAARAGLKPGDMLITLDGRWTTSILDVFRAVADIAPGREIAVVIQRNGKGKSFVIQPLDGA